MNKNLTIAFFLCFIMSQKAFAYLDPGTGSMAIQVILASIITIFATFKIWFNKLLSFFKKGEDEK